LKSVAALGYSNFGLFCDSMNGLLISVVSCPEVAVHAAAVFAAGMTEAADSTR
jgi:hypothetical protein